uniref:Helicase ATP-binding domain-containing protein n=1 Tax=viral metagenome TaxID=1070528 RepID=A0A6C0IJZ8_9ZZZZ
MSNNTYLGPKGYTIYKECLEPSDLKVLKEELNVRAYVPTSPIQSPAFPVYREAPKKIYLPRYYGIQNYGPPEEIKIPQGTDIQLNFNGDLRDYQNNIIDIYLKHTDKVWGGGGLLEIPCGRGKTVIALKIIAQLKKKTLVIVHKGFLLNQWIERIEQFLPTAKVGRIQGQIMDIEGKDIVIGMLQSLSMKEYPEDLFSQFGLTIVDECHHISSEVFSRSLQKIITFYTLGLSATMQRKDGLSKVFKMFLGDIVYKEKREDEDPVLVKAIEYKTSDEEFNKMCFDYRGNPAYSTMISKLCAFSHRSEFILKVVERELSLKAGQQLMILAHNKNILTYLYKAIEHRQLATVGYYVGGMKDADLKKSETCQVIIATYAMAAEALDIKTLTTLLLATPKTDIIQAVGRILRVKHERPLVIDIIDTHDVFIGQWQKRRKYYSSNKYKILHTNSGLYLANITDSANEKKTSIWKTLSDTTIKKNKTETCDVYVSQEALMKGKCLINI